MALRALGKLTEFENFTIARRRAGVDQTTLAEMVGTRQNRISGWERGRVTLKREMVDALWTALDAAVATGEVGENAGTESVA